MFGREKKQKTEEAENLQKTSEQDSAKDNEKPQPDIDDNAQDGVSDAVEGEEEAKPSRKILLIAGAAALVLLLLIGGWLLIRSGILGGKKNIAATVNGKVITKGQLDAEMDIVKAQKPSTFKVDSPEGFKMRRRLLNDLIERELVAQAAVKYKVSVSDEEVNAQIEALKASYGDEKKFDEAIKKEGYTLQSLSDKYRAQILLPKIIKNILGSDVVDSAKRSAAQKKLLTDLRDKADIVINDPVVKSLDK
jgi:hypothetical protein